MRIAVVGGTGRVGSKVVDRLRSGGHQVSIASRRVGVDVITREGLREAIDGAEVVVDLVDSPDVAEGPARWFFETSTQHLLAAERAAQVQHHVALSMVGVRRIDRGYFRAKLAQEDRIRASGFPYTILRSTQTFELTRDMADHATDGGLVRLAPIRVQPVALEDVATALEQVASGPPLNATATLAGPQQFDLDFLTQRVLEASDDRREVIPVRQFSYLGVELGARDDCLIPDIRIAPTQLQDWTRGVPRTTQRSSDPTLPLPWSAANVADRTPGLARS